MTNKDRFISLNRAFINTDHIVTVQRFPDGTVRIWHRLPTTEPGNNNYWDYNDLDECNKILAYFEQNSTMVAPFDNFAE